MVPWLIQTLQAEDHGESIRKTFQRAGEFRGNGPEDAPENEYWYGQNTDEELNQPPGDENRTEEDFQEGFHD